MNMFFVEMVYMEEIKNSLDNLVCESLELVMIFSVPLGMAKSVTGQDFLCPF